MERDLHNAFNGLRFHSPSSDKELASESSELWARLRHHSRLAFLGTLVHKTAGPGTIGGKNPGAHGALRHISTPRLRLRCVRGGGTPVLAGGANGLAPGPQSQIKNRTAARRKTSAYVSRAGTRYERKGHMYAYSR